MTRTFDLWPVIQQLKLSFQCHQYVVLRFFFWMWFCASFFECGFAFLFLKSICQPYCCIWREFEYSSPILTPKESRHSLLGFVVVEKRIYSLNIDLASSTGTYGKAIITIPHTYSWSRAKFSLVHSPSRASRYFYCLPSAHASIHACVGDYHTGYMYLCDNLLRMHFTMQSWNWHTGVIRTREHRPSYMYYTWKDGGTRKC